MRGLPVWILFWMIAFFLVAQGCAKKSEEEEQRPRVESHKKPGSSVTKIEMLKGKNWDGIIRGRVVIEGEVPTMAVIASMLTHQDKEGCLAGALPFETKEQKWIVGNNKAVANVLIYLKPGSGKHFLLKEDDKHRTDKVVLDQFHCAFVPHVAVTFPSYYDGTLLKKSGEEFIFKNSAKFNHNTSWQGDPLRNPIGNRTLRAGDQMILDLVPESNPIRFHCDIHPWMYALVWAFDNPYAAVTNLEGTFEIKNVPTNVEIGLGAWHEAVGFFHGGKEGEPMKFKEGENRIDLSIRAK